MLLCRVPLENSPIFIVFTRCPDPVWLRRIETAVKFARSPAPLEGATMPDNLRPSAATMRSRVAIEIAAELVAAADQPYRQAKVLLRDQAAAPGSWPVALFGSSTVEGVKAVACQEASLAMVNP